MISIKCQQYNWRKKYAVYKKRGVMFVKSKDGLHKKLHKNFNFLLDF